MSIGIRETLSALHDMSNVLNPDDEFLTILAAEQKFASSEASRRAKFEEAYANLKALSKVLEAARITCQRPANAVSADAHAASLNELDASRLIIAKSISDTEDIIASKDAELAALKDEALRLEASDPATDHEKELDGTALRLQIYRGIGFEPVVKSGKLCRIVVSNSCHNLRVVECHSIISFTERQNIWRAASE